MIPYNDFPLLVPGNHRVTSPVDYKYNCIAWAAGDTHRWWQPGKPYYWPVAGWPKNDAGLGGLVKAFASLGYVDCEMDDSAGERRGVSPPVCHLATLCTKNTPPLRGLAPTTSSVGDRLGGKLSPTRNAVW